MRVFRRGYACRAACPGPVQPKGIHHLSLQAQGCCSFFQTHEVSIMKRHFCTLPALAALSVLPLFAVAQPPGRPSPSRWCHLMRPAARLTCWRACSPRSCKACWARRSSLKTRAARWQHWHRLWPRPNPTAIRFWSPPADRW